MPLPMTSATHPRPCTVWDEVTVCSKRCKSARKRGHVDSTVTFSAAAAAAAAASSDEEEGGEDSDVELSGSGEEEDQAEEARSAPVGGSKRGRSGEAPKGKGGKRRRLPVTVSAAEEAPRLATAAEGALASLEAKAASAAARTAAHKSGAAALARVGLTKEQLEEQVAQAHAAASKKKRAAKGGKRSKGRGRK